MHSENIRGWERRRRKMWRKLQRKTMKKNPSMYTATVASRKVMLPFVHRAAFVMFFKFPISIFSSLRFVMILFFFSMENCG